MIIRSKLHYRHKPEKITSKTETSVKWNQDYLSFIHIHRQKHNTFVLQGQLFKEVAHGSWGCAPASTKMHCNLQTSQVIFFSFQVLSSLSIKQEKKKQNKTRMGTWTWGGKYCLDQLSQDDQVGFPNDYFSLSTLDCISFPYYITLNWALWERVKRGLTGKPCLKALAT